MLGVTVRNAAYLLPLSVAIAGCFADDPESPQAKHEWSILQHVEFQTRGTSLSVPEFRKVQEYELMAVPGASGERVWVMLKPTATPYYKQMPPTTQFTISSEIVNKLILEQRVTHTVAFVLRTHEK